jgi:hypothetical protein
MYPIDGQNKMHSVPVYFSEERCRHRSKSALPAFCSSVLFIYTVW